jgi:hypothetical protein
MIIFRRHEVGPQRERQEAGLTAVSTLSFFGFLRMTTSFPENVVARIGGLYLAEL